jgi:uncharacterized protein (TIGR02147 family)
MNQPDISIYNYMDYRQFLSEYYNNRKKTHPAFSYRSFAKRAGLGSPSHFRMIVLGQRNLSLKTLNKFATAMAMTKDERAYFEKLVGFNQAEDENAKVSSFSELLRLKSEKTLNCLEKEKYDFLSKWYMVAIYVLIGTKTFQPNPQWIRHRLGLKVSERDIEQALIDMEKLSLIEKDEIRGYVQNGGALSTDEETRALAVFRYHSEMTRLAQESLETDSGDIREFNGATVSIPKDKLDEIKDKIREFRKSINKLASSFENTEEVYQLNVQFFPLTKGNAE